MGDCENVVVAQNEEVTMKDNFLPLSLGNSDLILGIEWLDKLGTVKQQQEV